MGSPPPVPPVVTKVSPLGGEVTDYAGSSRVFQVSIEPAAIVKVYFDGGLLSETSIATASHSHTFSSAPIGEHVVRFVAVNSGGTGEAYWNWNVITSSETSPVVTLVGPSGQVIEDSGSLSTRNFEVSVNQPSRVRYYLNGDLEYDSEILVSICSVTLTAPHYGQNIISVIAENSNGKGLNHWKWIISRSVDTPQPPKIILQWPQSEIISTIYGISINFSVFIEPAAEVEFFLDEISVLSIDEPTNFACYRSDNSCSIGLHALRIYAQNAEGSDEIIIYWTVHEQLISPIIEVDLPSVISNLKGDIRNFEVHVNTACSLEWFIDGILISQSDVDPLIISFFNYNTARLGLGEHSISFVAKNLVGQSEKSAIWIINDPTDIVRCTYGEKCDINGGSALKISVNLFERRDGSRFVEIYYYGGVGLDVMASQHTGDCTPKSGKFDVEAQVSWPIITAPGDVINYPKEGVHSNAPFNNGIINIEVPSSGFYIVDVNLKGTCNYYKKVEGMPITLEWTNDYDCSCSVRLSF